jgi:hypothetical protein
MMLDSGWIAMLAFVAVVLACYWSRIAAWIERRWFRG